MTNSHWSVRSAAMDDGPLLTRLEREAFGAGGWGDGAIAGSLEASSVQGLIAHAAGLGDVGFALWRPLGDEAEILTIGVSPEARRLGGARALLSEIVAAAAAADANALFLEVADTNIAAVSLYVEAGFERVGRRKAYYRDGRDALVMRLRL